jgi:hypothetical protein
VVVYYRGEEKRREKQCGIAIKRRKVALQEHQQGS